MLKKLIRIIFNMVFDLPFGEKLIIIVNILVHDWRIHLPVTGSLFKKEKFIYTQFQSIYHDLEPESQRILQRFLWKELYLTSTQKEACCYFYNYSKIYSKEERKEQKSSCAQLCKIQKKYHLAKNEGGPESLLYHHGLDKMSQKVLNYIQGKDFIDAGAFYGESTFVLSQYHPRKIYAFEPSPTNRLHFSGLMEKVHVPKEIYELVPYGLDSQADTLFFFDTGDGDNDLKKPGKTKADLITLDSYVFKNQLNVGLIKADVEGMGLEMLKGAHETILKYRPVLSLSIYHNQEEFFGIYPLLKEWKLNYHFHVRSLSFPFNIGEITLIGIPEELLK